MKAKTIFALAMLAISTAMMTSCSKDGDTTKPIIELNSPDNEAVFERGGTICVNMDLSDDTALASFTINIHNAFNGHDHSRSAGVDGFNTDTDNAFAYNKTAEILEVELEGGVAIDGQKNANRDIDITIDADAAYGDYHLMVYCTDVEGNESFVARSFQITEDGLPHLHVD